jgi:hypothetical protein
MNSMTRPAALAAVLLVAATLAGCAPTVSLEPAPDAVNPACAAVIVRLPDTVATLPSRETNAQATGAWGEPTGVLLRCGVPVPPPTAEFPCVPVDGVDWLRDDTDDPNFVFTTYGRDPAIEVIINSTVASGVEALTDLSNAISLLPKTGGECRSLDEVD